MYKRITSLALVFLMVLSMFAVEVPAFAASDEPLKFDVVADKTEANPGDTINFTVYYEATQTCTGIQFDLDIPAGLTYVPNSGEMVSGFKETANAPDEASFTEITKRVIAASLYGMTLNQRIGVVQFQCTVDDGATGIKNVTLKEPVATGGDYLEIPLSDIEITGVDVNVTKAPTLKFDVTADKTEANPGDTINFTAYYEATSACTGIQFDLDIPAGLTYVPNSGELVSGFKETANAPDEASFTEITKRVIAASLYGMTLNQRIGVVQFQCTVDDGATGIKNVTLKEPVATGGDYLEIPLSDIEITGVDVNVTEQTNPAKPSISVTGTYTYTGSEQTASVTGYDADTMNISGNTGTNAGGYTVSVTSKTGTWADGSTGAVTATWTIEKATPTYTVPTGLVGTKGNALSTVSLTSGWTWKTPATVMNTAGNQIFKAVFTPADTANYNIVEADVTVNVKEPVKVTVSGTVTSFRSETENVTVQLFADGQDVAAYTATVTGNSASYSIENVLAGTYTMKVSKANHVTREYTVTVVTNNVTQDVQINLLGDVDSDGIINTSDTGLVNSHVKGKKTLAGYVLSCADVEKSEGSSTVDINDVGKLNAYVKGKGVL